MERIDKLIASTRRWSRREAKVLIRAGRVSVNGAPPAGPEAKADPETVQITVDGEPLILRPFTYVMLNKPAGYLSATEDGRGATVLDLMPREWKRLFPVGRLDKATEGLLLLTDDGQTAHRLLSPRRHVDKVYFARVSGRLTAADCAAFRDGVALSDFLCLPAELEILSAGENESTARVTVREGKFHQVRRMFAALGRPVTYLERVQMGNLPLDPALPRGKCRLLSPSEIECLLKS